jgi:hypothetical protein
VTGDPRLALVEKDRELAYGKLHPAQKRENPQPRRIGKGL